MKTGGRWSSWKSSTASLVLVAPMLSFSVCGCAKDRDLVEKNLMAARHQAPGDKGVEDRYCVGCPDVIEVRVAHREELSGRLEIGPDGKIDLGDYGKLRVEGRTAAEIGKMLAGEVGAAPENVQVRVDEFRSAYVILFGEVAGWQRSIAYRGQETVLDLLQRVGGITVGAEPKDVYVVRPHMGDNQRPEMFHIDLQAIVVQHDARTDLRLLPFDQIYVGETRQAKVEKALPPWLRWITQAIWDTRPNPSTSKREESTPTRWIEGEKKTTEP